MKIRCNVRGAVAATGSLIVLLALVVSPASGSVGWGVGPLFHLDTTDVTGTISGVVVASATGLPLADATIEAAQNGQTIAATQSSVQGEYSLSVPPGEYIVRSRATGFIGHKTAGVQVATGVTTPLNFSLGRIYAGDESHPPDHFTAWDFEQDHVVVWSCDPSQAEGMRLYFSYDGGLTWPMAISGLPASGTYFWPAASVWDISTTQARIRYVAVDGVGEVIGELQGESFALVRNTDILLKPERHVFTWPQGPPNTARYEIAWDYDELSGCNSDFTFSRTTPDAAPYYQISSEVWPMLSVGRWTYSVTALDEDGAPLEIVQSDRPFILCDLQDLGENSGEPVLLVHGWTGGPWDWTEPDNNLVSQLADRGFDAWAIAYPSIGDIRQSAAGLGRAIHAILELKAPATKVRVIAHSMGGLVSRAYIQGLARTPGDQAFPYSADVSHLVTLGTPHLGAPAEESIKLIFVPFVSTDCRAKWGPAPTQMEDQSFFLQTLTSEFLQDLDNDLSSHPLDPSCRYLFVAGSMPSGWPTSLAIPESVKNLALTLLRGPGDGVVPVRSALAIGLSENQPGLTIYNAQYAQTHDRIKRFEGNEEKTKQILPFLRDQSVPSGDLRTWRQVTGTVQRAAHGIETGVRNGANAVAKLYQRVLPDQLAQTSSLFAGRTGDDEAPVWVAIADSSGCFSLPFIPTGSYEMEVSCKGSITQVTELVVDSLASGWSWEGVLEDDPSYVGPMDPWILINNAAPATSDSAVTVSLGVADAIEMQVSERPDFSDAVWAPVSSPLPWIFQGGNGTRSIFARFRNGAGIESAVVGDGIYVNVGATLGTLAVSTDPAGATVLVDGTTVPGVTPLFVEDLAVGSYTVSVMLPGYRPDSPDRSVEIVAGQQASLAFSFTPRQPPVAFGLLTPAAGGVCGTTHPLFRWESSSDPESGSAVAYELQVSRDSTFTATDVRVGGFFATEYSPTTGLADSTAYAWRARAVTAYGLGTWCTEDHRWLRVDVTPPDAQVIAPSGGEVWVAGQEAEIRWHAADWSGVDSVCIALSLDGGSDFRTIVSPSPGDSLATWAIPDTFPVLQTQCRIRVQVWDQAGNERSAASDSSFVIIPSSLVDVSSEPPRTTGLSLGPVVPNPNFGGMRFVFNLPSARRARLSLLDVAGREIMVVDDSQFSAGTHHLELTREREGRASLSSGMYYLRLDAGTETRVVKFIVVR